ncbi:MAG: glycoside hydrolase family 28 protein [Phycisphaerae bacterium]|nr:glycoside hydrolase family 28 protein [Phycisphaerae bacterium]
MRVSHVVLVAAVATLWLGRSGLRGETPPGKGWLSVKDFGAVGDGKTKDTAVIQRTIDAASKAGGGTVYLPPGKYLSGTVYLKDRVTLHVAFAATLLGSTELADYPANRCAFRSYTDKYVRQALIWGEGLHDVAITGRGVIDGQGGAYKGKPWLERPYVIRLVSCRNVLIRDVTLLNSPMWMQHYLDCDFVTVRGISVFNHCNGNNDMIDIDCCRDVIVADCFADTDDDALTLKSTADRPTENVTVTNCLLSSHCNAIKCGTESNGGFKNITISNCAIRPSRSTGKVYGRKDGLAGIALEIVDGGTLDRVTISNIVMVGRTAPIFMRLGNRARLFKPDAPKPGVGTFRNVIVSNVVATEAGGYGCAIAGLPGHPIENVTLSDIKIRFVGGGTAKDADRTIEELPQKYPESTMFEVLPAYGFYCRHVKGLTLRNVDVGFEKADHRAALVCEDVRDLDVESLKAQVAAEAKAVVVLDGASEAMIRGCRPYAGTGVFLRIMGQSSGIAVVGNDLTGAKKPFAFGDGVDAGVLRAAGNVGQGR